MLLDYYISMIPNKKVLMARKIQQCVEHRHQTNLDKKNSEVTGLMCSHYPCHSCVWITHSFPEWHATDTCTMLVPLGGVVWRHWVR